MYWSAVISTKVVFGKTIYIVTVTIGKKVIRKPFATEVEAQAFVDALGQVIDDVVVEIIPV